MQATPNMRAMVLAGQPVLAETSITVVDKYTQETIARVASADSATLEKAISAAHLARDEMAAIPACQRAEILHHCASQILLREEEFTQTLIQEAGKPRTYARLEVLRAADTFRCAAEEAIRFVGEVIPMETNSRNVGYRSWTKPVPIGVCALITPFNFPLNLVAHKVAPAIAAGCPWILKPASSTPLSALLLGDVLRETSLPPHAYSILPASRQAADLLTTDPRIQLLSFTGSDAVGWDLKSRSGKKHVALELGGNAACLIDDSFPHEQAIDRIAAAAFAQAGQSCISIQRLFLHDSIYEPASQALIRAAQQLPCGDPNDPQTVVGPLIHEQEATRTLAWIESAQHQGARLLLPPTQIRNVLSPAILDHVPPNHPLACQEAFAPVLVLEPFSDYAQALDAINDSRFGLQAGIFTTRMDRALMAWDRLHVGGVLIGEVPSWRADHMPYGGVKDSGLGREGIRFAMKEMSESRLLVIRG